MFAWNNIIIPKATIKTHRSETTRSSRRSATYHNGLITGGGTRLHKEVTEQDVLNHKHNTIYDIKHEQNEIKTVRVHAISGCHAPNCVTYECAFEKQILHNPAVTVAHCCRRHVHHRHGLRSVTFN